MQLSTIDHDMMRLAFQQAERAASVGEVPVGAVVYRDDRVLAQAHNLREHCADPTGHAEVLALREAGRILGTWRLDGCRMAVTLEPCPMCAGALVNSRIEAVIFGVSDPTMGCVESHHGLLDHPSFNHRVAWQGGVMSEPSLALLRNFFKARRGANKPAKPKPGDASSPR